MARGRKRTTGKYQTVKELEEMVQFFSQTQDEAQVGRTCGISPATVRNILERTKEKNMSVFNSGSTPTIESLREEIAKLNAALNCFFIMDPEKGGSYLYNREQAEAMARAALEPVEKLTAKGE